VCGEINEGGTKFLYVMKLVSPEYLETSFISTLFTEDIIHDNTIQNNNVH
jgi:hypothetical protein